MLQSKKNKKSRRGITTVEICLIMGVIIMVVLASVSAVGTFTSNEMNDTATRVGDTSSLPGRFGGDNQAAGVPSDGGTSGGGTSDGGTSGGGDSGGGDSGGGGWGGR